MIRLSRVRLINWHNFVDETLTFDRITYLIGVNAVGKTTILDAIRYCLTTNKDFNALGNRKSARTLQGSVHGKQRGENAYTRRGHTVSYIGVEFLDQKQRRNFVITVRVESESPEQELRHVRQTWYISPLGVCLDDLPFLDPKTNAPSSREGFSVPTGRMQPIDRQSDAKNQICQRLGIGKSESPLGKKFSSVFPMGTSLDEIHDFRTFIYEYVLPQPVVDLEDLQRDEQELENLQETLTQARQREQQLKEIVALGDQAMEKERDVCIQQGLVQYAQYQADSMEQARLMEVRSRCIETGKQLEAQYLDAQQQADKSHDTYWEAKRALQDSEAGALLEVMRKRAKDMEAEIQEQKRKVTAFRKTRAEIEGLLQSASRLYRVREDLYPDAIRSQPQRNQPALLDALESELAKLKAAVEQAEFGLRGQLQQLDGETKKLGAKIRKLEKGQWVYPDQDTANIVKTAINDAFAAQGLEQDAKILCELLYMNDDTWQDCVEACLGYRRFDILVSPEHYAPAKAAFEHMGDRVGSVSLLDSCALYRDRNENRAEENSLAEKVSSENPLARTYIEELLGGIVCCEDSSTLEKYPNSATRDLLRHYPYRLTRLKRRTHFIGLQAKKQQLAEANQRFREGETQKKDLSRQIESIGAVCESARRMVHRECVATIRKDWNCEETYEALSAQYLQAVREIEEWENSPLLRGLQAQEQLMKTQWDEKRKLCEAIAADRKSQEDRLRDCESQISQLQSRVAASLCSWERFQETYPLLRDGVEGKYAQEAETRTPEQIAGSGIDLRRRLETMRDDLVKNQLIPMQRQFNQAYSCDLAVGMDGIAQFRMQYAQLIQIDLERYCANLQKAKERCRERFRKDILYRMKDDIQNARRQFSELNKIMKKLRYGEEMYQFQVRESQDGENSRLYHLIMSDQNTETTMEDSMFNLVAMSDPAYEAQIDEFVERILSAAKEAAQARQKGKRADKPMVQLVDYRQYLDYDILITNTNTGESVPLSKVSQDSSGGENQAPFYIAICASLLQIYQKCDNSIRLVLLDEAFSKMTSDRIKPMMQMFRQMELQVLMITTVEKASAIYPLCDITYSIVKSGSRNAVAPFYLEVKEDGVCG